MHEGIYRYSAVRMESEMASLRVVTSWIHLAAAALRMWKARATLASDDTAAPLKSKPNQKKCKTTNKEN